MMDVAPTSEGPLVRKDGDDEAAGTELHIAAMALDLRECTSVEQTMARIVEYAMAETECDAAATVMAGTGFTVTATTVAGDVCDQDLRLRLQGGPCAELLERGDIVMVSDTHSEPHWAPWSAGVAALGFGSVLCVPLRTRLRRYASLNLFARRPRAFGTHDVRVVKIFASHAAVALASAHAESGLKVALASRELISQAQGILRARFDLAADTALGELRAYARAMSAELAQAAQVILDAEEQDRLTPRTGETPRAALRRVVPTSSGTREGAVEPRG
ncbi:GAF domain-containing protein [Pseudactinotalea sp. HY158]|nr:GAF domain-containing protein [Pseudactinotalea sp. HY158]